MTILITGHKGFIGSHLTKKLGSLGLKWIGYDLVDGNDIRNKLSLERVFDSYPIEVVIHLASLTGARRGEEYPQEYFDTNVIGTENVARLCEKYGVKKLIAFSSASAKTCMNTYGITKHAMELMLERCKVKSIHVVRPFNVYGENGRPDQVIWKWKNRIEAGLPIEYHGNLKRNYTYVGDLIEALLQLLSIDGDATWDFGSDQKIGLENLLNLFIEKYPGLRINKKEMEDVEVSPEKNYLSFNTDFITKVKELLK